MRICEAERNTQHDATPRRPSRHFQRAQQWRRGLIHDRFGGGLKPYFASTAWPAGDSTYAMKRCASSQLIIDCVPGNGGMFSLERPTGLRVLTRSRLFDDEETAWLAEHPVEHGVS